MWDPAEQFYPHNPLFQPGANPSPPMLERTPLSLRFSRIFSRWIANLRRFRWSSALGRKFLLHRLVGQPTKYTDSPEERCDKNFCENAPVSRVIRSFRNSRVRFRCGKDAGGSACPAQPQRRRNRWVAKQAQRRYSHSGIWPRIPQRTCDSGHELGFLFGLAKTDEVHPMGTWWQSFRLTWSCKGHRE